ncbi:MAG: type 1 glutamine amidotransferase [Actinomycetota bacterium]|nr:type 1 glutamine amidotransferase [Actinomycetota bacterium]
MDAPRLLVVQLCDDDGPGRAADWLRAAGLELDVRRGDLTDPVPADLSQHAGLLVLGGHQAAYDPPETSPELPPVTALLRIAVHDRVPALGICLGGQLLARALGGQVRAGVDGPELGGHLVAKKDVAAQDPVFGGVPFTPDVIQWHYDEIAALPVEAVLLASSPLYPYQAFRVGSAPGACSSTSRPRRTWSGRGRPRTAAGRHSGAWTSTAPWPRRWGRTTTSRPSGRRR